MRVSESLDLLSRPTVGAVCLWPRGYVRSQLPGLCYRTLSTSCIDLRAPNAHFLRSSRRTAIIFPVEAPIHQVQKFLRVALSYTVCFLSSTSSPKLFRLLKLFDMLQLRLHRFFLLKYLSYILI